MLNFAVSACVHASCPLSPCPLSPCPLIPCPLAEPLPPLPEGRGQPRRHFPAGRWRCCAGPAAALRGRAPLAFGSQESANVSKTKAKFPLTSNLLRKINKQGDGRGGSLPPEERTAQPAAGNTGFSPRVVA